MTSWGTEAKGKYLLFTLLYLLDFEPYEFLEKIKMSQNESKKFKQTNHYHWERLQLWG